MAIYVNQEGVIKEVVGVYVRDTAGEVKEVKAGWARQGSTINQIYSTSVEIELPAGTTTFRNLRTSNTAIDYNASLHELLPAGVTASAAAVVNLTVGSGYTFEGSPTNGALYYNQQWGNNSTHFAETSAPALYIGGTHRGTDTTSPTLAADNQFPDGLIVNITIAGGTMTGGSGRPGNGPCNNHGCHNTAGRNSGGSGGPIILVDGVNNCTINYVYQSGTVRAGGGGGAGGGWGAGHSQCCPKTGGQGAGGYNNGSVYTGGQGGAGASHGGNSGSSGGGFGADGGDNGGWPGGHGGPLVEFRNSDNGTVNTTGSTGTVRATTAITDGGNYAGGTGAAGPDYTR